MIKRIVWGGFAVFALMLAAPAGTHYPAASAAAGGGGICTPINVSLSPSTVQAGGTVTATVQISGFSPAAPCSVWINSSVAYTFVNVPRYERATGSTFSFTL